MQIDTDKYMSVEDAIKALGANQAEIHKLALDIEAEIKEVEEKERAYRSADCRLGNLRIQLAKAMKVNAFLLSKLQPKE
jgi:hypothetical protein